MTNERAIEILSRVTLAYEVGKVTITQAEIQKALEMAIKALESQPCEEKAVLIKDVKDLVSKIYEPFSKDYKYFMQKVDELPTVTPQKNGKWIAIEQSSIYQCSECGLLIYKKQGNYCHNCGAKMDGGGWNVS